MRKEGLRVLVVAGWPLETFIDRLLCGLAGRGVSLTVMSRTRPSDAWLEGQSASWCYGPGDLNLRSLAGFARRAEANRTKAAGADVIRQLVRPAAVRMQRSDVIYAPWIGSLVDHPDLTALGLPVVTSCRGAQVTIAPWDPARPAYANGLRRVFRDAARVHCVSEAMLTEAQQFGLDPAVATVITPAVDPTHFVPRSEPRTPGPMRVIAVGSLIWRKNLESALVATKAAVEAGTDMKLHIIGDGPDRQRLRFTIADLGLEEHVELLGNRTSQEVGRELANADVFLHTSMAEGISNAVLEAMASGLPVITTDAGGMDEAVRDGIEGFVVQVRDATATAAALVRCAEDPALRAHMGIAGRTRILDRFRLDQQIDAFHTLLTDAASGR